MVGALRAQSTYATPYTFTTLAGLAGFCERSDGTGSSARFLDPEAVAVDANGTVYIGDTSSETVRKITSAGVVTTIADRNTFANASGGSVTSAQGFSPMGLALDASGNLYVAGIHYIFKITGAGTVTMIAGAGGYGSADGPTSTAQFSGLKAIAVDAGGDIYVADATFDTIRKVSATDNTVSTFAGTPRKYGFTDGAGTVALFNNPTGLAIDADGNLYVADTGNFTIRKITSAGVVSTLAGSHGNVGSADGTGTAALFYAPTGIAIDSGGNLYVSVANNTIRKVTGAGIVTTLAGTPNVTGSADGTGPQAQFSLPLGIGVDGAGDVFIADSANFTIRERYAASLSAPTITAQPASLSVAIGASATFSVSVAGVPAPSYQWAFDGAPIAGATNPTLSFASVQAANLGAYSVSVSNSAGTVASGAATLASPGITPGPAVPQTRLANISSRVYVGAGDNIEIAGFVVSGPPAGTEQVLVRAVGPSLAQFGVSGVLVHPVLTVYNASGVAVASNTVWGTSANAAQIASAAAEVGAFALSPSSADSAVLVSLPPGPYTAQVSGQGGSTGVALAEVYEIEDAQAAVMGAGGAATQLVNISTRAEVGGVFGDAIAGIVVSGNEPATVLIRAVGPALAQFGLGGALAQPGLNVVDSAGNTIAVNYGPGWSSSANASQIASATAAVGAFELPSGSADCAMLLTLQPGAYTVVVVVDAAIINGVGPSGVALVEAYLVR
jgi:sugar lactone lactonase YvrE